MNFIKFLCVTLKIIFFYFRAPSHQILATLGAKFQILQGSVATLMSCYGLFNYEFIASFRQVPVR